MLSAPQTSPRRSESDPAAWPIRSVTTKMPVFTLASRYKRCLLYTSATMEGLKALRSPAEVARIRGKSVEEILG